MVNKRWYKEEISHHYLQMSTSMSSTEKIKVYARGWLNYYGIASMKNNIDDINGWLYHRIRMCIWKQWKKPRTKVRNLIKMGYQKTWQGRLETVAEDIGSRHIQLP